MSYRCRLGQRARVDCRAPDSSKTKSASHMVWPCGVYMCLQFARQYTCLSVSALFQDFLGEKISQNRVFSQCTLTLAPVYCFLTLGQCHLHNKTSAVSVSVGRDSRSQPFHSTSGFSFTEYPDPMFEGVFGAKDKLSIDKLSSMLISFRVIKMWSSTSAG